MRIAFHESCYYICLKIFKMKRVLLVTVLFSTLVMTGSFTNTPEKQAETATVYIYRVGQFTAAGANWSVFADGEKICKLSNNKFIKQELKPGKHIYEAKVGGVGLLKKETELELEMEAGKTYYIACNVKASFTRARMELIEVTKSTGEKQMAKMSLDNCQEKIDEKEGK